MLAGRFLMIIPVLAIGRIDGQQEDGSGRPGNVSDQRHAVRCCCCGVVIIVGALTFFPALSLGPIVEHLRRGAGKLY